MTIRPDNPLAVNIVTAVRSGDIESLKRLLTEHKDLAGASVGDRKCSRSMLHIATDWPGHFPNVAELIATLVEAGADVNARFVGNHTETPLHWAASSDDIEALDALLDAGADIEAQGAVLGGGSPLSDAVGFRQWNAAQRLVERGAKVDLRQAAALGMMDYIKARFDEETQPATGEINLAFWYACHGGQRLPAEYLLDRGADINWLPPWENLTPLDAAIREKAAGVVDWLRDRGAKSAAE